MRIVEASCGASSRMGLLVLVVLAAVDEEDVEVDAVKVKGVLEVVVVAVVVPMTDGDEGLEVSSS